MFDIAWSEYLLIGILALILLGPKELPVVMRTLGGWLAKLRQTTNHIQQQFYDWQLNEEYQESLSKPPVSEAPALQKPQPCLYQNLTLDLPIHLPHSSISLWR